MNTGAVTRKRSNGHADAQRFLNVETGRIGEVQQGLREPNPGDRSFDELCPWHWYFLNSDVPTVSVGLMSPVEGNFGKLHRWPTS